MASSSAFRRLMQEYKEITQNPSEGLTAGPLSEDNFFEWEAYIMGPADTPYDGGMFTARLVFPPDYPLNPPKMRFVTPMWHPNIYPNGEVCISILHPPGDDPTHYESAVERWSPVQSVEKILISVISMLAEPNDESGANLEAARMWRDDREEFNRRAEETVRRSLVE
eukprot:TRINITY_DN325_c0_g1_i5.p2 TRINITY_DN325_c0_g1~~TRINITY_DN325_c0_g1_i5.p2  ORF type:complete len:167 (+),score=29.20 TRINITY_DN325_c0_g1_i5:27-527(+)